MSQSADTRSLVLLLAITAHGFGHAAQCAPVVNRLRELCPGLDLIIVTDLKVDWLRGRFAGEFRHVALATDPGFPMRDPLTVDWPLAAERHQAFFEQSERRCAVIADIIVANRVDIVLADVPWLPVQVAARLGVPAVAMCSLNWADILRRAPKLAFDISPVVRAIEDAYRLADLFIRTEPAMPMEWLDNVTPVGPIAMQGKDSSERIRQHLGLDDDQALGLVQFGGIDGLAPIPLPIDAQVHWIASRSKVVGSPISDAEEVMAALDISVVDVVASVDLMLTKPGYGSFAEAACHGTRVLSVERVGWPEAPYLEAWMQERCPVASISAEKLYAGDFKREIDALLQRPSGPPLPAIGTEQAARLLLERLKMAT